MRKNAAISFVCLLLAFACLVSAAAMTIDGKNNNNEWLGNSVVNVFPSGEIGNSVNGVSVMYDFTNENTLQLFISPQIEVPKAGSKDEENFDKNLIAVKFSFEGSDEVIISVGENDGRKATDLLDDDSYKIRAALTYDSSSGTVICEIEATDKNGFGNNPKIHISIVDGYGKVSNRKSATIENPAYTTTTTAKDEADKTSSAKNNTTKRSGTTAKSDKTTTRSDVSIRTSAATSYKSRVTKRTTTKATTEKTTKLKTTKEKTTKVKTTGVKTTKAKTTKTTTARETVGTYQYTDGIVVENTSAVDTTDDSLFEKSGLSDSMKYKIAVGAGAALLFIIIAVSGMRTKAQADREEENEKHDNNHDKDEGNKED